MRIDRIATLLLLTLFCTVIACCLSSHRALAAIGCDLNDPDRDVYRLFKEATRYKTVYVSIGQLGGATMLRKIEKRLGEKSLPLYAPIDVPYTLYEIYRDKEKIGYIHGVNQKGQFGGIQVFMSQDLRGRIKTFYIQKISGQRADRFRTPQFAKQFTGLTLRDFSAYDPVSGKGSGRIGEIRNPAPELETDFYGILRGLKKNLVLMEAFVFSPQEFQ